MPRRPEPDQSEGGGDVDVRVGSAVRDMYIARRWKQKDLAAAIDVSVATFQRLLKGEVPWTVGYLVGTADQLRVDPAAILKEAGVSDVSADSVMAVGLDPTLDPDAREAVTTVIRTFRNRQPGAQQERHLRELGFEFDRPRNQ